jgi:hypothetical protein
MFLSFNGQMQQHPIKCTYFSSETESTVLQWIFKLNSAPTAAEMWDLTGCKLKVNNFYGDTIVTRKKSLL